MATVPGFCVGGRFVRPACHLLRKSQQACVALDKPCGKVTMTNAHPLQDEHSLAHGCDSSVQELLCDFVPQKGGIVATGMWPNVP